MFDTLYAQASRLSFPEEIEKQFRVGYFRSTRSATRIALALGIFLYSIFGILDVYAAPVSKNIVWFIRFGVVDPVFITLLILSYIPRHQKNLQPLMSFGVIVAGLGITVMIAVAGEAELADRFYFGGLLLVSMWAYGLSRLMFRHAVFANLVIVAAYETVAIGIKHSLTSEAGTVIFIVHNFFFLSANVIGMFTSYLLERFSRREFVQMKIIASQRDQADALLYNILPGEIAEKLKHGDDTTAEEFESASVLFADLVNFTPISARYAPREVVEMLNEMFSSFDGLVDKHGVEKIQVAGDAYMAAAGVPVKRSDHAHILARLALDMQECVRHGGFLGGKHPIEIRIGLNSGPLLAGVIGRKKYFYALWGDTVNTASRMQSQGVSGKIQITRATYELLKDDFECEFVGEIAVKGKGTMEAWHLIREKEQGQS